MRDLTVSNSINLNGCKEFNRLRIPNINDFFDMYGNNLDCYSSPFQILLDLESKIMFENNPEEFILIPYKRDGDIIFRLIEIKEEDHLRVVVYAYDGSCS